MPNSVPISHNVNAVHPLPTDGNGSPRDEKINISSLHMFSIPYFKHKKSVLINLGSERKIHVQQYAQNDTDLYDERNPCFKSNSSTALIFMIHGVGASSAVWDPQVHYFLSHRYDVVTFDLLGHGLSSKPQNLKAYEFHKLANDVLEIFDQFCKKTNILIGHSYGSSFCTLLSKERSELISKVVLISGGGPTTLKPEQCSTFCLPLPIFKVVKPVLVKLFRRMAFHENTTKVIRNKVATFAITSHALKAVMQGQKWPFSDEQYHADLLVPVLLIHGEGDKFVSLQNEIWMNETIYGSELKIIKDAGHMSMVESPTLVNSLIHQFLNRDSNTRSNYDDQKDPKTTPSKLVEGVAHEKITCRTAEEENTHAIPDAINVSNTCDENLSSDENVNFSYKQVCPSQSSIRSKILY